MYTQEGVVSMRVSNYTNVRQNFSSVIEEIVSTDQPVIVTKKDINIVMISLERFNYLERQARNNEYLSKLHRSYEQARTGNTVSHELIEVE